VKLCPPGFPAGFYWYGHNQKGIEKIPQWVELLLSGSDGCSLTSHEVREEEMNDGDNKTGKCTTKKMMNQEVIVILNIQKTRRSILLGTISWSLSTMETSLAINEGKRSSS